MIYLQTTEPKTISDFCTAAFSHLLMVCDPQSYLGRWLQAVLQVFARWIISEEGKSSQLWFPHANPLVQRVEELLHCSRPIESHYL